MPGRNAEAPGRDRPVDLVHLARQTLDDRRVEREVLRLFLRQSALQLARLSQAITVAERRAAAHTLAGAARAVGAWPIARIAGEIEASVTEDAPAHDYARLTLAIDQTASYIRSLLGDTGD